MFIIDISNIMTLLLVLAFTGLVIYLGRETKKSFIPAIALGIYLVLLVVYVVQFMTAQSASKEIIYILSKCMAIDFLLILASYLGYLWVDTLATKDGKKKTYGDDLDWLWKKI